MMASAPLASARMVRPIAWLVEFEPVPAMTAMRLREILTAARIMASCSAGLSVEASPIVVGETMGEASTLSPAEHDAIIRAAVNISRSRIAVIAGAGSNSTSQAISLTMRAEANGADAIMSVVPYYNKPMQAGIVAHFRAIAASTTLPIILHDAPARTARELSDETVQQLAGSAQFAGAMDASGNVARLLRLKALLPPDFRLLTGEDSTASAYLLCGGDGCISVESNVTPCLLYTSPS